MPDFMSPSCRFDWRMLGLSMVFLTLFFLVPESFAQSQPEKLSKEQFLRDYRAAVAHLQEITSQVRVKGRLDHTQEITNNGPTQHRKGRGLLIDYRASGGHEKFGYSRDPNGPANKAEATPPSSDPLIRSVILSGNENHYLVTQSNENAAFYLKRIEIDYDSLVFVRTNKYASVSSIFSAGFTEIHDYVNSQSFVVDRVEQIERDGESLIRAEVRWTESLPPNSKIKVPAKINGWILLDPGRSLAIREYSMQIERTGSPSYSGTQSGVIEYTENTGLPIPKVIKVDKRSIFTPKIMGNHYYTFQVDQWDYEPTPPYEFSLAAYGLEDPRQLQRRGLSPFTLATITIGVIALVTSLIFRQFAGRFRRQESNKTFT